MKRFAAFAAAFAAALAAAPASAQKPPVYGCDSAQSRELDFWVGEWSLRYVEDGKPATSRSRITKILGGCAILEEFSGPPGTPLEGRSLSTYDKASGQWKQTWVDNNASYLDFTGGMVDGRMILEREAKTAKGTIRQRMVFQDIRHDGLKWLWQRSSDGGKSWTTQWEIDYTRAK